MNLRERAVLAAGGLAHPGFAARAASFGGGGPDKLARLNELIKIAAARVPGYAAGLESAGLAGGLRSLAELPKLPPVTRAALSSGAAGGAFASLESGGTAGAKRFETRLDFAAVAGRYAALLSVLKETGWRMGDRTIALHPEEYGYFENFGAELRAGRYGKLTFEFLQQYGLYRLVHNRRNLIYSRRIFSDPAAAEAMAAAAAAARPALLISRPDALMASLKALRRRPDLRFPGLKGVLTVGTALGAPVRREARERLGAEVYDMYASTELGYAGLSCQSSDGWFHADEGWHIVENGPGGELLCTDLGNSLTPLLRYPTGDAGLVETRTCACGRRGTMLRVDGRVKGALETSAGPLREAALIDRVFPSDLPFFQVDAAAGKVLLPPGAEGALPEIGRLLGLPPGRYAAAPGEFKISSSGKFCYLP